MSDSFMSCSHTPWIRDGLVADSMDFEGSGHHVVRHVMPIDTLMYSAILSLVKRSSWADHSSCLNLLKPSEKCFRKWIQC